MQDLEVMTVVRFCLCYCCRCCCLHYQTPIFVSSSVWKWVVSGETTPSVRWLNCTHGKMWLHSLMTPERVHLFRHSIRVFTHESVGQRECEHFHWNSKSFQSPDAYKNLHNAFNFHYLGREATVVNTTEETCYGLRIHKYFMWEGPMSWCVINLFCLFY
jgi:hypothetical protein